MATSEFRSNTSHLLKPCSCWWSMKATNLVFVSSMDLSGPVGVNRMTTGSPSHPNAASASDASNGRRISRLVSTSACIFLLGSILQMPAGAQETIVLGFKAHVHTVFTESFKSEDSLHWETMDSSLDVYDPTGYQLEFFRYKPDG